MAGKTRPCLRKKTLENLKRCNLSETDKSCITNVFEAFERLSSENKEMVAAIKDIFDSDNVCKFCENKIECKKKECEKYCEGVGDADGKFPDWKWTCEDFDFGTCPMMIDTPCYECFDNNYSGFKWRMKK